MPVPEEVSALLPKTATLLICFGTLSRSPPRTHKEYDDHDDVANGTEVTIKAVAHIRPGNR